MLRVLQQGTCSFGVVPCCENSTLTKRVCKDEKSLKRIWACFRTATHAAQACTTHGERKTSHMETECLSSTRSCLGRRASDHLRCTVLLCVFCVVFPEQRAPQRPKPHNPQSPQSPTPNHLTPSTFLSTSEHIAWEHIGAMSLFFQEGLLEALLLELP